MTKPSAAQTEAIRYFNGSTTPGQRVRVTEATYAVCVANGWLEKTDAFPYHRTLQAGADAIGEPLREVTPAPAAVPARRVDPARAGQYDHTEPQTYPGHSAPLVVDQLTIAGIDVDVVRYAQFVNVPKRQEDPGPDFGYGESFYAIKRGATVATLALMFYVNDGPVFRGTEPSHRAGDRAPAGCSSAHVLKSSDQLGRGDTAKAAITSAKRAIAKAAELAHYKPIAEANIRTFTGTEFYALDESAVIEPGDLIVIVAHNQLRLAVAAHVTKTGTVNGYAATPSGRYAQGCSGKLGKSARLYRKAAPAAPVVEQAPALVAEVDDDVAYNCDPCGEEFTSQAALDGHEADGCWASRDEDEPAPAAVEAIAINAAGGIEAPMTAQPGQQHAAQDEQVDQGDEDQELDPFRVAMSLTGTQIETLMTGMEDRTGRGLTLGTKTSREALRRRGLLDDNYLLTQDGREVVAVIEDPAPAAGTFAALNRESHEIHDNPRVVLPSGLSGRVRIRVNDAGRYFVGLVGFGVGDINVGGVVEGGADVVTTIDAMLRGNPGFVAILRRRQAEHWASGRGDSPLSLGRDLWLAGLDDDVVMVARYSRQALTLAVGPAGVNSAALDWINAGRQGRRDETLRLNGWERIGEWTPGADRGGEEAIVRRLDNPPAIVPATVAPVPGRPYADAQHAGRLTVDAALEEAYPVGQVRPAAALPVHLRAFIGDVYCDDRQEGEEATDVRADATCRGCEFAIAREQLERRVAQEQADGAPVVDAFGDPVDVSDGVTVTVELRMFMAGRVPAAGCPHYISAQEARAGIVTCENRECVDGNEARADAALDAAVEAAGPLTDQDAARVLEEIAGGLDGLAATRESAAAKGVDLGEHATPGETREAAAAVRAVLDALDPVADHDVDAAGAGELGGCNRCPSIALWLAEPVDGNPNAGRWVHVSDDQAIAGYRGAVWADILPGTDTKSQRSIGKGAQLEIEGVRYDVPDRHQGGGVLAPARLSEAIAAAGYEPAATDGYYDSLHPSGRRIMVRRRGADLVGDEQALGDAAAGDVVLAEVLATAGGGRGAGVPAQRTDGPADSLPAAERAVLERIETHRICLQPLLTIEGFTSVSGRSWFSLHQQTGVSVGADRDGILISWLADHAVPEDAPEGATGTAMIRLPFGTTFGVVADLAVGLTGQQRSGVELPVRHVTRILPRDSAGHWAWDCDKCPAEATGYETARGVIEAASAHGPLSATSLRPVDDDGDGVVRDARARVEEALEVAGRHGLTGEEIRADLGDLVEQIPMALGDLLTQMYEESVILANGLPASERVRFYTSGAPCDDCEGDGKNCLAHRTYAQRLAAGW